MKVFIIGCLLFCFAILFHLILWKIRLPNKQLVILLKIFCSILMLWFGFSMILLSNIINFNLMLNLSEILHITALYISLSLSYVAAYSTIEADSPSLRVSMILLEKGEKGLDKQMLLEALNMDQFFSSRLGRLIEDKMIKETEGGYALDAKGMILMNIVLYYRRILKISEELG